MMVLLTAGPIPAKVDSVKYLTNRFRGGLAAKTATALSYAGIHVEVVKWRGVQLELPHIRVHEVDDVISYRDLVIGTVADAYILAAAVANLMPVKPWEGKFPSHLYGSGDEFDVKFRIAPRIIDEVRVARPGSTLIGYKLFDGTNEELIQAGFETMRGSKANVIFCNRPETAKSEKIALTADGARIRMSFEEHVRFIVKTLSLRWYRTEAICLSVEPDWATMRETERLLKAVAPSVFTSGSLSFGTLAVRADRGFVTTTRGKRNRGVCHVFSTDPQSRTVLASAKATMNAPLLDRLLRYFPHARYVVHSHQQLPGAPTHPYAFPGTTEEDALPAVREFNVEHHGCYAVLDTEEELLAWADRHRL